MLASVQAPELTVTVSPEASPRVVLPFRVVAPETARAPVTSKATVGAVVEPIRTLPANALSAVPLWRNPHFPVPELIRERKLAVKVAAAVMLAESKPMAFVTKVAWPRFPAAKPALVVITPVLERVGALAWNPYAVATFPDEERVMVLSKLTAVVTAPAPLTVRALALVVAVVVVPAEVVKFRMGRNRNAAASELDPDTVAV